MWTQSKTDRMILHAENETVEALGRFLTAYFKDRMPTVEEVAMEMNIPEELAELALASMESV
jgi:hypothetical protein